MPAVAGCRGRNFLNGTVNRTLICRIGRIFRSDSCMGARDPL